jgi:hypothetical protein
LNSKKGKEGELGVQKLGEDRAKQEETDEDNELGMGHGRENVRIGK